MPASRAVSTSCRRTPGLPIAASRRRSSDSATIGPPRTRYRSVSMLSIGSGSTMRRRRCPSLTRWSNGVRPPVVRIVRTANTLRDCTSDATRARDSSSSWSPSSTSRSSRSLRPVRAAPPRPGGRPRHGRGRPCRWRGDVDRQQVRQGRERDRSSLGMTARPGARHAGSIGELEDLLRQAGLADAGAAGEEHATGRVAAEALRQHLELAARARSSATPRRATVRHAAVPSAVTVHRHRWSRPRARPRRSGSRVRARS